MTDTGQTKSCFIIAPIGEAESAIRKASDKVLRHIIRPTTEALQYKTIRADEIADPGLITMQVIQHLVEDDLVIADLSGHNPNVFYELAIRHVVRKPIVQIIAAGEGIPFDIAGSRTIVFDLADPDSILACKDSLEAQIRATETNSNAVDNPISVALNLSEARNLRKPEEKKDDEMLSLLFEIRSSIEKIETNRKSNTKNLFKELTGNFVIVDFSEFQSGKVFQVSTNFSSFQIFLDRLWTRYVAQYFDRYTSIQLIKKGNEMTERLQKLGFVQG